jgi:hypothetical protein
VVQEVLKNPSIRIDAWGVEAKFRAAPLTDAKVVKSVVEKFREKYGTKDVKKYYSKFGAAVLLETMRWLLTQAEALRAQGEQQQACVKFLHPIDLTPGEARLFAPVPCKVEECPGCRLNFRGGVSSAFSTSLVTVRKRQGGVRRGCSSIAHANRPQSHSANLIPVTLCRRRCCTTTSANSCSLWMNSWRF